MAKMGRIVTMKLGKIDKKAMVRFLDESLKGMDGQKDSFNPKEFEVARKTLRGIQKKVRKCEPNEEFNLSQQEYDYLRMSLDKIVEYNQSAFDNMFFLKRWFYKLMAKNYEHLAQVVKRKRS